MRLVRAFLVALAGLLLSQGTALAQDRIPMLKQRMATDRPIELRSEAFVGRRIAGADWYRDAQLQTAWFGPIYLDVTVGPSGEVTDVEVSSENEPIRDIPPSAMQAAIAGVRQWRFRPLEEKGRAIPFKGFVRISIMPAERIPARLVAFPEVRREEVTITFDRRGPYGHSYNVVIGGDGRVVIRGSMLGGKRLREFSIPVERVEALIELFRAADFWSLDERYESLATDQQERTLTFNAGGASHTVLDYFGITVGMPDAVTRIETEIDEAIDIDRWTVGNARTVASLKAEGFDFTSPAAADMFVTMIYDAPEAVLREVLDQGINLDLRPQNSTCVYCSGSRTYREAAEKSAIAFRRPVVLEWIHLQY